MINLREQTHVVAEKNGCRVIAASHGATVWRSRALAGETVERCSCVLNRQPTDNVEVLPGNWAAEKSVGSLVFKECQPEFSRLDETFWKSSFVPQIQVEK